MAFTETFIQVAVDGAGKMVRNLSNLISGNTVFQQVVTRAKSDGTLMDDEATETTLGLIKAKTDNLDAALSTRATEATLALVAKDVSLAALAKDATLGALSDSPGAYTVADRLNRIGKTVATEATLKQVLSALKTRPPQSAVSTTLLHRS